MSTRAIAFLKSEGIPYEIVQYPHEEKGAAYAARALGYALEATVKTLVVDLGNRSYSLALMPGHRQLDMKKMARACGVKRAAMADTATAERLTGYRVGGISPFATQHPLSAVMEESLLRNKQVLINAGQRGTMLQMDPAEIVKALGCPTAALC